MPISMLCNCVRGTLSLNALRNDVSINSVSITGSPSIVAPMNWTRFGWRKLAAIDISRINTPWL